MNQVRPLGAYMTLLLLLSVIPQSAAAFRDAPATHSDEASAPPRRAPHDTAKKLADQLSRSAAAVSSRLKQLPPGQTHSERAVWEHVVAFASESDVLRRHLTRFLIEKKPAFDSLDRLQRHAWSMHKALDKAPKYKAIWSNWARTVSILRRLQKAMPRRH